MSTEPSTSTAAVSGPATPTAVPAAVPPAAPTGEVVAEGRARIDELDQRIIALVQERMATSAEIQAARLAAGGTRVSLNREMVILARYRSALGPQGTEVAMQLLELCRGRS